MIEFEVLWVRNSNYGIGSGREIVIAKDVNEALHEFWKNKNKEAYEVSAIIKK